MQSALDAARVHLAQGEWPVPIPAGQKGPVIDGWPDLRLAAAELPAYFHNGSNIGLLLGQPSRGLTDVDLDCGEARILAPIFLPRTGRRHGRASAPLSHWWYLAEGEAPQTRQFKDTDGTMLVELRGTGGQTMVPPSIHPDGEQLAWAADGPPAQVNISELCRAVVRLAAAALLARHWPAKGSRHETALAVAGLLARAGWTEEETTRFVTAIAEAAGDEEAADRARDVGTTFRAVATGRPTTGAPTLANLVGMAVVDRVRTWLGLPCDTWDPPIPFGDFQVPPFPTDVLPDWLRQFVERLAIATQTPPDLAGMLALSAVATACAGKVHVVVKPDYTEPLNIFTATVLAPGNRKSAVFAVVTAPIQRYEQEEVERLTPDIAEAQTRYKIAEAKLQRLQTAAAKATTTEQEQELAHEAASLARELAALSVPAAPRLLADDISPERLATLLRDQGGRMAVMSPEGTVFDLMAGRYSKTGSPNFDVYLKGHAGDTLRVDRVSRPAEYVQSPALTLGLAIQPDVLRGVLNTPGFRGRGLLGRFLYALPPSPLGRRDPNAPSVAPEVLQTYNANVRSLLALSVRTGDAGARAPYRLQLDEAAMARLRGFEAWLEPQLGQLGALGAITDWAGKLAGAVARLAGILHMGSHPRDPVPWAIPVAAATVDAAIRIAAYLIPHAQAAYAEMGVDPVVDQARYVLALVRDRHIGSFGERQLFQAIRGRFKRMDALRPVLGLLQAHGFIRRRSSEARSGPGRPPGPTYDVNPHVHEAAPAASPGTDFEDSENFEPGAPSANVHWSEGTL